MSIISIVYSNSQTNEENLVKPINLWRGLGVSNPTYPVEVIQINHIPEDNFVVFK